MDVSSVYFDKLGGDKFFVRQDVRPNRYYLCYPANNTMATRVQIAVLAMCGSHQLTAFFTAGLCSGICVVSAWRRAVGHPLRHTGK
jgi:hypothetical protein